MKIILEGIVGSKAYGLDTPESDTDIKGIFVYPTEEILSLHKKKNTINQHEPDVEYHEVVKFMNLASQCNPTILELLFLDNYTQLSKEGEMILEIRDSFLNKSILKTYGGYATHQAKKMWKKVQTGQKHTRHEKHARHCFRLLQQGRQLLETGSLDVRVNNREELFAISKMPVDEMIRKFEDEYEKFKSIEVNLPDRPDYNKINDVLSKIRRMNYGRD